MWCLLPCEMWFGHSSEVTSFFILLGCQDLPRLTSSLPNHPVLSKLEQIVAKVTGAILKQLVGRGGISNALRQAFQEWKTEFGGRRPRLPGLMGMLTIAIASLPGAFICFDALDACLSKHLLELLGSTRDIVWEFPREYALPGGPMLGKIFREISPRRL